jgi:hypothetical protein
VKLAVFLLFALLALPIAIFAQEPVEYTNPGTYNLIVPEGYYRLAAVVTVRKYEANHCLLKFCSKPICANAFSPLILSLPLSTLSMYLSIYLSTYICIYIYIYIYTSSLSFKKIYFLSIFHGSFSLSLSFNVTLSLSLYIIYVFLSLSLTHTHSLSIIFLLLIYFHLSFTTIPISHLSLILSPSLPLNKYI